MPNHEKIVSLACLFDDEGNDTSIKNQLKIITCIAMITRLIVSAIAVLITAYTLDGVTVEPWWWAVVVAIVLGLVNAFIRPLVKLLALPINFLTLGLFTFVINGLMVMLCSWIVRPHFEVDNLLWAMVFSFVLTIVNWGLHLFVPSKK